MAAPEIKEARLGDANVFVGAKQEQLRGAGPDDYFSVEANGDYGTMVSGIQEDVMLVQQRRSGFVATFTFIGACSGVDKLLDFADKAAAFLINITYNDFSLSGYANVMNIGAWVASSGTNTRTITVNIAKVSGATNRSIGRTVEVG
jgi:hypothetical protein